MGSELVHHDTVSSMPTIMTTKKHSYKIPFPETFDVKGVDNIPLDQAYRVEQILNRRTEHEHDLHHRAAGKGSWRNPQRKVAALE